VSYNGIQFHRVESSETEGAAMIGYGDQWASLSFSPDYQFGLVDNLVIESIGSDTIVVKTKTAIGSARAEGGTTGELLILNGNAEDLVIAAANLTGENAADFSVLTALPLTIAPGEEAVLAIRFDPAGPNGEKAAELEIVSNDPGTPSLKTELVGTRAIADPLMAHFTLDDPEGSTAPEDASGNVTGGSFQERDPVEFEQESLIGGAGTSVNFTAAQDAGTGSYMVVTPLHTPTISISLWIKPEEIFGDHTLFNRDPLFDAKDAIYGCFIDAEGALVFRAREVVVAESDPEAIVGGEIYHVVITHLDEDGFGNDTARRTRMSINGVLVSEAEGADTIGFDEYPNNARTRSLHFATRTAAGSGFTGGWTTSRSIRSSWLPIRCWRCMPRQVSPRSKLPLPEPSPFNRYRRGEPAGDAHLDFAGRSRLRSGVEPRPERLGRNRRWNSLRR